MKKLFLAVVLCLLLPVLSWGADVKPIQVQNIYMWDLGAVAATGNSNTLAEGSICGSGAYMALITASGTVAITAAFHVTGETGTANDVTVQTYTLTAASTTGYTWSFPTPRMYIAFAITTGAIDRVKVFCKEK